MKGNEQISLSQKSVSQQEMSMHMLITWNNFPCLLIYIWSDFYKISHQSRKIYEVSMQSRLYSFDFRELKTKCIFLPRQT